MNTISAYKVAGYTAALSGGLASMAMGQAADLTFEANPGGPQTTPLEFSLVGPHASPGFTEYQVLFGSTPVASFDVDLFNFTSLGTPSGGGNVGFFLNGTEFRDIGYAGGLLPLDAIVTAADVTATPGSIVFKRFTDTGTNLHSDNGITGTGAFSVRGLWPFTRASEDFLGFLDVSIEGESFGPTSDFVLGPGFPTNEVEVSAFTVHGGRGILGSGNDLSTLSLAGPDAAAVVPVPAALPLLAGGVGALAALRRRRRKAA